MEKADSSAHSLTQSNGVPVVVNPIIMRNDMEAASMDMKITVGPDDVVLPKKNVKGNM